MDQLFRILNYVCSGVALIFTVLMLLSYRKERPFQPLSLLFSAALSLIMMFSFVWLTGARLSIYIAVGLFVFGLLIGGLRAFFVKLYRREDRVVGKYSLLSLLGWGGSYALAILMNSFDAAVLASLGLAPLVLATGTQVSMNGVLFVRRLFVRK